ncbi:hypothetical protein Tco_1374527 [Tanacetum coccineum]
MMVQDQDEKQRSRRPKRNDTEIPQSSVPSDNIADEAVNKEMDASLVRAATTATGFEAERQETMRDTIAQTRSENVSKLSNDPLLARGNTLRSGEDSLKLLELMALCTTLQSRVLAMETTKTTQANEIACENASKQGRRIHDIDADEDIALVNDDNEMFDVGTLTGDEVLAEQVVVAKDVNLSVDEVTFAQALAALKISTVRNRYALISRRILDREADECDQNISHEQVFLSSGDIYDDPPLLKFHQNNDIPLWGNYIKEEGEEDLHWVLKSKFEDDMENFMMEKKHRLKGLREMLDQQKTNIYE